MINDHLSSSIDVRGLLQPAFYVVTLKHPPNLTFNKPGPFLSHIRLRWAMALPTVLPLQTVTRKDDEEGPSTPTDHITLAQVLLENRIPGLPHI